MLTNIDNYQLFVRNNLLPFGKKEVAYLTLEMFNYNKDDLNILLEQAIEDNLLHKHIEYFPPNKTYTYDEVSIEIPIEEYKEMESNGHFYNPETGQEDLDYKNNINFFYSPTNKLIEMNNKGVK